MNKTNQILSVESLKVSFGDFIAVNSISFSIAKGKTLAIVGESGSGKSLTAFSLIGLLPKSATVSGKITIKENVIGNILEDSFWKELRGDEIGIVFQEPMSSLNPVMKIGKQIAESILLHQKLPSKKLRQKTIDWLRKVQLPEPDKIYNRYPHELSGGQKQRVMIAMAMCNSPTLLIADEPTTALDVTVQQEIVDLMKGLQEEEGTAMIFITHDLALAYKVADDILVMYNGEIVESGDVSSVLESPQKKYTRALVACRPSPEDKGKRLLVVDDFMKESDTIIAKPFDEVVTEKNLLDVRGLKVWFDVKSGFLKKEKKQFKAVDDVSFKINKGEVLGLVGESGCGKSTISKSIMGLLPIKEGDVLFEGEDISTYNEKQWKKIRREIQLIFQDPFASLNPRLTIGEMLREPLDVHHILARDERSKEVSNLLDRVGLPQNSISRYAHQFSGGQRQRIGIARALAVRPKLLICDESVSALDISVQAQVLNLLKDLQVELGLSYLFVSHDLNVVHYISDRVMVMNKGKLVEIGKSEQVLRHPQQEYTKRLIRAMP